MTPQNPYTSFNHSTEIAMSILELLAESREPMRLRDISTAIGANASTVLRFLNTFIRCGYAEQDPETQKYHITYKLCRLANQIVENTHLQSITHPYLLKLSGDFNESACISVERNMQMVYIDVASGQGQLLMSRQQLGAESPMHCTGNGKLMLLNYTEKQLDDYIQRIGLIAYTENTITDRNALLAELSEIRKQGFAEDREECELGVRCLAFPIYDYTGNVVAGLSMTGPISRMTPEALQRLKPEMASAAREISKQLGYV